MANFTPTTNPMSITATGTCIASRPFLAKEILWYATGTGTAACVMADLNSNVLAQGIINATLGNSVVTLWAAGGTKLTLPGKATATASWQVSTLTFGSLLIYF